MVHDGSLRIAPDLVVDRHYRGAIVMIGTKMFAISEAAIRLIETIQRGAWDHAASRTHPELAALVEDLLERGVLNIGELS